MVRVMEPNRIMLEPTAVTSQLITATTNKRDGGGVEEEKEEIICDQLLVPTSPQNGNGSRPPYSYPHNQHHLHHHHHHPHQTNSMEAKDKADVGDENGFRAQIEAFTKAIFGSCGSAIEATSFFLQERGCRWPHNNRGTMGGGAGIPHNGGPAGAAAAAAAAGLVHVSQHHVHQQQQQLYRQAQAQAAKPALSIADELRKLAIAEGRNPNALPAQPRSSDIPKFLGEDAVHSIDDDNISAISQHTLEEMAHKGYSHQNSMNSMVHPMCRRQGSNMSNTSNTGNGTTMPSKSSNNTDRDLDDEHPPSPTRTQSLSTDSSKERRRQGDGTRAEL